LYTWTGRSGNRDSETKANQQLINDLYREDVLKCNLYNITISAKLSALQKNNDNNNNKKIGSQKPIKTQSTNKCKICKQTLHYIQIKNVI